MSVCLTRHEIANLLYVFIAVCKWCVCVPVDLRKCLVNFACAEEWNDLER